MIFDWYKIFNLTDFMATNLVSRNYQVILGGIGLEDILITRGNLVSALFDGVLLSLDLNDKNPFYFEDRAIYLDNNNDVWVGKKVNED